MAAMGNKTALSFQVKAKCSLSKARSSVMKLLHSDVDTPVFMPVGTQVRIFAIFLPLFKDANTLMKWIRLSTRNYP
jgi:queuine tRNA-ribosyltransferase